MMQIFSEPSFVRIPRAPRGQINIERKRALDNGIARYFGNPCKYNHDGWRYAKSGSCVKCRDWIPTGGKVGGKPNTNRLLAIQNGENFYYSGKPCKRGHTSLRPVTTSLCLECFEIYKKTIRKSKQRQYSVSKRGITLQKYDEMLLLQKGVCAICKQTEKHTDHQTKKLKKLAIDHCHNTDKIRGLLCTNCNLGIGNFKDNPEFLRKAALYCEQT